VFIAGEEELKKGKGILRYMDSKKQSEVPLDRVEESLEELLAQTAGG
jgi:histidyl-tRNA synthetase